MTLSVGLICWAYPPEKSGLSRAAREIAQALAGTGADVRVFTMDRETPGRDDAVEVIGCGLPTGGVAARVRGIAGVGHAIGPARFRRAVLAAHARRPLDVVEATNWYAPGAGIALASPLPLVTRSSTPAAISAPADGALRDRIDRRAAMLLEAASARASAGWISNTRAHGDTIARLYGIPAPGARHHVIGLSLPADLVARGQAAGEATGTPLRLLFIGRNEPRKGFAEVLAAVTLLAADAGVPSFELTMVGARDQDLAALPPAARARIRPRHRVPESELHDLLAAAHVVVAPSRYESFGIVYQEAMMFGRPVVACAEDASARLFIGDSGAGVLATDCSGAAIAEALRPLLLDATVRARHATAARTAAGRFTRETLGAETLAAYRSAIASNARRKRSSSSARPAPADIPS